MLVTKQFRVPLASILFFSLLWKSVATNNWLSTHIIQNTFFYVQQKKKELEGEQLMTECSFLGELFL